MPAALYPLLPRFRHPPQPSLSFPSPWPGLAGQLGPFSAPFQSPGYHSCSEPQVLLLGEVRKGRPRARVWRRGEQSAKVPMARMPAGPHIIVI